MSKTRLEVVNQAAKRLGILATGQSLPADDYDAIDNLWEPLCEELAARQVYVVGDVESVDDNAFLKLADLLAIEAAPTFSFTAQALATRGIVKQDAEDKLEVIAAGTPSKGVLSIERFWG